MIATGARVRLRGLQAKPELNGQEGTCSDFQADAGRWTVRLDNGEDFAFKVANLQPLQDAKTFIPKDNTRIDMNSLGSGRPKGVSLAGRSAAQER
mmetsp:Transcript_32095/g.81440  ORF Transcript_32095/g.81440 Transcript_32095/m.81440 type:complete len:95 (-) Transcript_32095:125-409(-)